MDEAKVLSGFVSRLDRLDCKSIAMRHLAIKTFVAIAIWGVFNVVVILSVEFFSAAAASIAITSLALIALLFWFWRGYSDDLHNCEMAHNRRVREIDG